MRRPLHWFFPPSTRFSLPSALFSTPVHESSCRVRGFSRQVRGFSHPCLVCPPECVLFPFCAHFFRAGGVNLSESVKNFAGRNDSCVTDAGLAASGLGVICEP